MSGSTGHIEDKEEAIKRSMEKYRQELLNEGLKEGEQSFNSLIALHKYFEITPQEELEKQWKKIEDMNLEGPSVEEYFESTNPNAMYAKGYREGALRYKGLVEEFLKGWVAQIKEKQKEDFEEVNKKVELIRKEKGLADNVPIFISPGVFVREQIEFHPAPIEHIIESYILPQMQKIFDSN